MYISPASFFNWKDPRIIVDIRPSGSFAKGSFSGAKSIPKENFEELSDFIAVIKSLHNVNPVHIIDQCGEISDLIKEEGNLACLKGGYNAFKIWREEAFLNGPPIAIIAGKTGCGKSENLKKLSEMGKQVIDLESCAMHRGSVFGALDEEQPSHEDFQNGLLTRWLHLNSNSPVWVEEKGPNLGSVGLPETLFKKLCHSIFIELEIPFAVRLQHIIEEYTVIDNKKFLDCLKKLEKRMGVSTNHKCIHYFKSGQLEKCFMLLLMYYDKAYDNKRKIYEPYKIVKVPPLIFENEDEVKKLEEQVTYDFAKKDPAVLPQGL